jgi:hypothetical protein
MGEGCVSYASEAEQVTKLKRDVVEGVIVLRKDETAAARSTKEVMGK